MFIIVEGPKCSGKTTLCTQLATKFGAEIVHFPTNSEAGKRALEMLKEPLTGDEYNICQDLMEQDIVDTLASLDESKLWLFDRSFISNCIYRSTEHIILKDRWMNILDKSMLIVLLASTKDLNRWIRLRIDKPLTWVEKNKLAWSNDRFHTLTKMLEFTEIKEVTEIKVGKYYIKKENY